MISGCPPLARLAAKEESPAPESIPQGTLKSGNDKSRTKIFATWNEPSILCDRSILIDLQPTSDLPLANLSKAASSLVGERRMDGSVLVCSVDYHMPRFLAASFRRGDCGTPSCVQFRQRELRRREAVGATRRQGHSPPMYSPVMFAPTPAAVTDQPSLRAAGEYLTRPCK
jgi:hypothetical protein